MVLQHFTEAPAGRQVMDGAGRVWTFDGKVWRHKGRYATSVALAAALNPDLAHYWVVES